MRIRNILFVVGFAAIPLWYVARTLSDKEHQQLDWHEIFISPETKRQRVAAAAKVAEEKATAERERIALEKEAAAAKRKTAEAELARLAVQTEQQKAEAERQRAEQERKAAVIAASRASVAAVEQSAQRVKSERIRRCLDVVAKVESDYRILVEEHGRYEALVASLLKLPVPEKNLSPDIFSEVFRSLQVQIDPDNKELTKKRVECVDNVERSLSDSYDDIERAASAYRAQTQRLRTSASDLTDLVNFVNNKLPNTIGGQIAKDRSLSAIQSVRKRMGRW